MVYTSSAVIAGRGTFLFYNKVTAGAGVSPAVFNLISELKKLDFTGSKYDLADVTNMQSGTIKEWITTLADAGELSVDGNWLPGEETQNAIYNTFFIAGVLGLWKIQLPAAKGIITFNAYVTKYDIHLDVSKELSFSATLKITGQVYLP